MDIYHKKVGIDKQVKGLEVEHLKEFKLKVGNFVTALFCNAKLFQSVSEEPKIFNCHKTC